MNIALCDDDTKELKTVHDMIESWARYNSVVTHVSDFERGNALLNSLLDGRSYDVFILDIMMPEMDGIELGLKLREHGMVSADAPIIYLTSSTDYALHGYRVKALNYLVKPVPYDDFARTISEAAKQTSSDRQAMVVIRTKEGAYSVKTSDIDYICLEDRAINYICDISGDKRLLTGMKLTVSFREATTQFDDDRDFHRCGASFIVNLVKIRSIKKEIVTFINGDKLAVPKAAAKPLYEAWVERWLD